MRHTRKKRRQQEAGQKRSDISVSTIALSAHNWLSLTGGAHTSAAVLAGLSALWVVDPPLELKDIEQAMIAAQERGYLTCDEAGLWRSNERRLIAFGRKIRNEWGWRFSPLKQEKN